MTYAARSSADLKRLVSEYPLAWIVSHAAIGFAATPLPLLAETDVQGEIVTLLGHFALSNPQVDILRTAPQAMILFNGPHDYISPKFVTQPGWAPTWNYAVVKFHVDVELAPKENRLAIEQLVEKMEGEGPGAWTVDDVGQRLDEMMSRIIAFRAHVRAVEGRFKLGQDETSASLKEILGRVGNPALRDWMADFNVGRLSSAAPPAGHAETLMDSMST